MNEIYDVIIIGGSFAGLSAAMSLGRAIRNVLIIDSSNPCNKMTPHSHNFITHDGEKPLDILEKSRKQVLSYPTIKFINSKAVSSELTDKIFTVKTETNESFAARKLIFTTGVTDIMPETPGFKDCWGISILHCPYCHGYEIRGQRTGLLGNGELGFELSKMINNWTKDLILFTNGKSTLTEEHTNKIEKHKIEIVETEIKAIEHDNGYIKRVLLDDGTYKELNALYAKPQFKQHCDIPAQLGCEINEQGFIKIDAFGKTSINGIYAAGDSTTMLRSISYAVSTGGLAGAFANKELIDESF